MKHGVDISTWQGKISFTELKSYADFIIPREGYARKRDDRFYEFVNGARNVGISIPGVYHFLYACSEEEAVIEAESAVQNVKNAGLHDVIIFADYEYDSIESAKKKGVVISNQKARDIVIAFCEAVKRRGFTPGVYLNIDFLHRFGSDIANLYDIWLAQWDVNVPSLECLFWQKRVSNSCEIPGIIGRVDLTDYVGKHTVNQHMKDHTPENVKRIAIEVVQGKWGIGEERKALLSSAGWNYATIQSVVNELLKHKFLDTVTGESFDTLEELVKVKKLSMVGKTIILT